LDVKQQTLKWFDAIHRVEKSKEATIKKKQRLIPFEKLAPVPPNSSKTHYPRLSYLRCSISSGRGETMNVTLDPACSINGALPTVALTKYVADFN